MVEYRIYADNYLIYSSTTPEIAGLIQPKLKLEVNKSGSLSFTMPSNHEYFNRIYPMKTLILVYQDNDILFRGRVIEAKIDFYKQKKVTCEGDLSFLLDSVIRPFEYIGSNSKTIREVFKKVIDDHNAQMTGNSTWKQFSYSNSYITVTIDETKDATAKDEWNYTSFGDTSSVLNSEFLDVYGGILRTRTVNQNGSLATYLDYIKDPSQNPEGFATNPQEIEFGVNLLELDSSYPVSDIFTVLMPIGSDKLTIESANNNSPYLENQEAINTFGRIVKVEQWSDVKKADELKQKGLKFLNQHGAIFSDDLTVKAIDLHYLGSSNSYLKLLDNVAVYSDPHDIQTVLLCLSVEYDFQNPENNTYKLGTYIPSDKHKGKTKKSSSSGSSRRSSSGTSNTTLSAALSADETGIDDTEESLVDSVVQTGKDLFSLIGDFPDWSLAEQLGLPIHSAWWDSLDPAGRAKAMQDALASGYADVKGEIVRLPDTITQFFTGNKYTEEKDEETGEITSSSGVKTLSETTNDIVKIEGDIVEINGREIKIGSGDQTELISIKAKEIDITGAIKNLIVNELKAETIDSIKLKNTGVINTAGFTATGRVFLQSGGSISLNWDFDEVDLQDSEIVNAHLLRSAVNWIKNNYLMNYSVDAAFKSLVVKRAGSNPPALDPVATEYWVNDQGYATQTWVQDNMKTKWFLRDEKVNAESAMYFDEVKLDVTLANGGHTELTFYVKYNQQ